jgi:hypothetical protein
MSRWKRSPVLDTHCGVTAPGTTTCRCTKPNGHTGLHLNHSEGWSWAGSRRPTPPAPPQALAAAAPEGV